MATDDSFITINNACSIEYIEKKSVFIATTFTVQSDDEALMFINDTKKKYSDATHNCYGYILRNGGIKRFSDDGEPSGTAGMPILNVIEKLDLCNTLVIVTRYFGGIKLGAGGLVRAYSTAAAQVLTASGQAEYVKGVCGKIEVDYDDFAMVERTLVQQGCVIVSKSFENGVIITLKTSGDWDEISKTINDMCRGGAIIEIEKIIYMKKV